ncbi:MAG: restriction endonuclease subunit S, partial [Firmicutes bacterium]|nr:restriction endonuclease subunit S [Bacillota bacterium]
RLLNPYDLLIEKSGGGDLQPVGTVVWFPFSARAACSNFIARIETKSAFDPRFLVYFHHHLYNSRVNTRSIKQTTGIQNLDAESYFNEPAIYPPKKEQEKIASFLDHETNRIDTLISKKQHQIELLEEKGIALIIHTVTRGLNPDVRRKDPGVEWLREVPEHWEIRQLKYVTECLDRKRIPLNAEQRWEMQGEYPYWGANGILDYVNDWLFDEELVLLGEDGAPFCDRSKPVAFLVTGKVWVNNHIHVLRPHNLIDPLFLTFSLNSIDYSPYIEGTTRDKLTQSAMNTIPVPYPPISEQKTIASFLDRETGRIHALTEKIRQSIETLGEYRSALITAVVTGQIDVREEA